MPMGPGEYAAEVDEGDQTTNHRVLLPDDLLAEIVPGEQAVEEQDARRVVQQALHYLLERVPNTSLGHDVDLGELSNSDGEFIEELRSRL
jgi:hypothetical protein